VSSIDVEALAARVLAGERAALARALTLLERDREVALQLDAAFGRSGRYACTVGITGAPGAGKSTLVSALLAEATARDQRLAVLALDPVSPLTRGAILGDRLRMESAAADERVFVRSMTADARAGGLSAVTPLAVRALEAAGWPGVLIETVGVGQSELDVVEAATTTLVVLNPGWGDEVQAVKAGLMEVADVFVINKADREGVEELQHDLERLVAAWPARRWRPPIVRTVAHQRLGAAETWAAIGAHRAWLEQRGELAARRRRFLELGLRALARERFDAALQEVLGSAAGESLLQRLASGEISLPAGSIELAARAAQPAAG
jgi:LAO/AO transport system kinase